MGGRQGDPSNSQTGSHTRARLFIQHDLVQHDLIQHDLIQHDFAQNAKIDESEEEEI